MPAKGIPDLKKVDEVTEAILTEKMWFSFCCAHPDAPAPGCDRCAYGVEMSFYVEREEGQP